MLTDRFLGGNARDGIRASAAIVPICQSRGMRAGRPTVLQIMSVLMSVLVFLFFLSTWMLNYRPETLDIWTVSPPVQENVLVLVYFVLTVKGGKLWEQTIIKLFQELHTPKGSFLFAFMMPLETFGNLEVK